MMKDYVEVRGYRIKLTKILDANNKRITDLPTIPEFIENGCPIVSGHTSLATALSTTVNSSAAMCHRAQSPIPLPRKW